MGAWGTGTFENDVALDFSGDIAGSNDGVLLIRHQLEATCAPGQVDAPAAEASLAAAEVIAAARGFAHPGLPPLLHQWVETRAPGFSEADGRLALAACRRVESGSELRDLWFESPEDGEAWVKVVEELRGRLQQSLGDAAGGDAAGGPEPTPGTEPWRLWEPLDPATSAFVVELFERQPALARAVEIKVGLFAVVKSENQFDSDLELRVAITPAGDVTVEFAGLEETFALDSSADEDAGTGEDDEDRDDADRDDQDDDAGSGVGGDDGDRDEAATGAPPDAPAIAIGPGNLADFLADLMAERVCVVHRYDGDELVAAFAVRTEELDAGVRAALALETARGRRLFGRKRRASAVVVSWTGEHDREVEGT